MVIVVNASHVELTHDKWNTKLYRWHTGKPAHVCNTATLPSIGCCCCWKG